MPLQYELKTLDGLSEEVKAHYQEKDGVFVLDAEGFPAGEDVTGLKNKVEELLREKKAEADARRDEEEKRRQAEEDAAKEKGDFEALSKSYLEKIQSLESKISEMEKETETKEIQRQAMVIASEISSGHNQEILSTFIESRLRMDGDDLKVTDEKGNLTISTIDQLKEEFKTNPKFGALVDGPKGSGSGASENNGTGGAGKKYSELTEGEKKHLYETDREEFNRLKAENG